MSFLSSQPYKGTRDFFPQEMRLRRWIFSQLRLAVEGFGFEEYDGPMLEPFELYAAKTGEEIVNQQLYTLIDRGERKLAVRPEMTPTLARMVASKIHELPRPIRWFSIPNLWRYERPQRGRLREHWQLNADILGGDPLLADAEIIRVALATVSIFGGTNQVVVKVNNRKLMDQFFEKSLGLSADHALQATKAIDARAKIGEEAFVKWLRDLGVSDNQIQTLEKFFVSDLATLLRELPGAGTSEMANLFESLGDEVKSGRVVFDPTVLRGMNYYTGTVFEIYDTSPENRRAMFGGGRYDNLVGLFGNHKLSGVGFGMGDVTLQDFLTTHSLIPESVSKSSAVDVFVTLPKEEFRVASEKVAQELRARGLRVATPLAIDGFGSQLKQATKHRARFAILFGDREWAEQKVIVKDLDHGIQSEVPLGELSSAMTSKFTPRR